MSQFSTVLPQILGKISLPGLPISNIFEHHGCTCPSGNVVIEDDRYATARETASLTGAMETSHVDLRQGLIAETPAGGARQTSYKETNRCWET